MIHTQMWKRLLTALTVGLVISLLFPKPDHESWVFSVLVGYLVSAAAFCLPLLWLFFTADEAETRARLSRVDPSRQEADLLVIGSALASLGVVGFLLFSSVSRSSADETLNAAMGLATVAASWCTIHTVFTLRYATHCLLVDREAIDFNTTEPQRLSDFAYFAFNLGMTYQVSDTALRSSTVRRIVLGHCVLSWIFGTVIIATTINLVVGLAP